MNNQNDDFFIKPKVDFAFKEIMMDDDALKGFLSAVLNINPTHIQKIIRKNTNMQKVHDDEKQAILDVRIVIGQGEPPKKQPESEEEQTEVSFTWLRCSRNRAKSTRNTAISKNVSVSTF